MSDFNDEHGSSDYEYIQYTGVTTDGKKLTTSLMEEISATGTISTVSMVQGKMPIFEGSFNAVASKYPDEQFVELGNFKTSYDDSVYVGVRLGILYGYNSAENKTYHNTRVYCNVYNNDGTLFFPDSAYFGSHSSVSGDKTGETDGHYFTGILGKYRNRSGYSNNTLNIAFVEYWEDLTPPWEKASPPKTANIIFDSSATSPFVKFAPYFNGIFKIIDPSGDLGEDSTEGGGDGDFDESSDPVPFPDLPSLNISGIGFVSVYELSIANSIALADFLLSDSFLDNVKKLFTDPMDYILSLAYLPFDVSTLPQEILIGKLKSGITSGILTKQFYKLDFGTLNMAEFWGNFLDYSTDIQIFLPYHGMVNLAVQDVMGAEIHLEYTVDSFTGTGVAHLLVKKGNLESVLYSAELNLGYDIPLSGINYSQRYLAMITGAFNTVGAVGGVKTKIDDGHTPLTGGANVLGTAFDSIATTAQTPPTVKTSSTTGSGGLMSPQVAYVQITRPVQSRAENFGALNGYPLNVYKSFSSLEGFNMIASADLRGMSATNAEQAEILNLLQQGVFF